MPLLPRVYADFTAIEHRDDKNSNAEMPLTGYGTLASLSRQRLRLTEGMRLVLYEPGDIEVEAVASFDRTRIDPSGRPGAWIARLDHTMIRRNRTETIEPAAHPCLMCGADFDSLFKAQGRAYTERCSACGTSVMAPMAPPQSPD